MVKKLTVIVLALILGMGSIVSFTSKVSAMDAGKIWLNDDDTITYATINDAVAAGNTGDTIRISGLFDTTNAAFRDAVVNNGMILEVVSDTTILNNDDDQNGITIASGSHIKTVNGSTLNIQGFKKALDLQTGAEMNDGNYVFKDNQDVTLDGNVKGTSRESLVVDITAYKFNKLHSEDLKLENATLKLTTSKVKTWDSPPDDGGDLPYREVVNGYTWNFKNVLFVGTGLAPIQIPNMLVDNSDVSIDFLNKYARGLDTDFCLSGYGTVPPSEIRNSTFKLSNTLHGIVMLDGTLNIDNSKIDLNISGDEDRSRNDSGGGILFNSGGNISIKNSELNFTRDNSYQTPVLIYGNLPSFIIGENTVINTPANSDKSDEIGYAMDNIVAVEAGPTGYVVTGGSFLVKYHTDNDIDNRTTPTNGLANGNEKLTYFQLADPSVTSLSPLNKNGQRYTYGVANPSSDGNKYVWVPSEKVTFSLGDNPSATFADGTNANKETVAMRGHTIGMAVRANDEEIPSFNTTPISNDTTKQFKGWFYRDATGNVLPFDPNTTEVLKTMNVFAMWEEVPQVVPTPTQPSQPTTSVTPKTSDNTNIGYQIGVLLVSLSAVVILLKARNLVTK
jgi:conserved repeat protein (list_Bact_rpt)